MIEVERRKRGIRTRGEGMSREERREKGGKEKKGIEYRRDGRRKETTRKHRKGKVMRRNAEEAKSDRMLRLYEKTKRRKEEKKERS